MDTYNFHKKHMRSVDIYNLQGMEKGLKEELKYCWSEKKRARLRDELYLIRKRIKEIVQEIGKLK